MATAHVAVAATQLLAQSWPQTLDALAGDELVAEFLRNFPLFPAWLERRMTAVRRQLLFEPEGEVLAPLLSNLAIQCHLNDYAWVLDAIERQLVERLAGRIERLTPAEVMALACYRRLSEVPGAETLLERGWTGPVESVLEEQLVRPREVRALAAAMPRLTPIREGVSQAVRGQYEIHPYPPWRRAGHEATITHIRGRPLPENPEVLIAGCGTGRHAVETAWAAPGARILAVDLSCASLAYAALKARELGLADRLAFAQADLLELAECGRTYDLVQAVGVVHHMADPFEGARAAARLVKPGGFLSLGLFSARARALLRPAKALARSYTPETIRELRRDILARPDNDPVKAPALNARDFYSLSGCRDLLMHVQEHEFGPIDVGRILDACGVEFLGFDQPDVVMARYREMFPDDPAGLDFANWEAFEGRNPSTFAGMYQFTAQKPVAAR
jgi:2-polyprenyl-3-methyl-5-hydroxy-6-metoxy-1,4-benzoquinol methylase